MAKSSYWELLKDPRWQRKRLEIMGRDNFTCKKCNSTDTTLHVHHKFYLSGLDPWEYADEHLITLCKDCHDIAGQMMADLRKSLAEMDPWFLEQVRGYIDAINACGTDRPLAGCERYLVGVADYFRVNPKFAALVDAFPRSAPYVDVDAPAWIPAGLPSVAEASAAGALTSNLLQARALQAHRSMLDDFAEDTLS